MRKLLAAAAMSVIAMAYFASPDVITSAVNGTAQLGVTLGRAALSIVTIGTGGTGTPAAGGGHVETLPDGTQVWVPEGASVTPATTP